MRTSKALRTLAVIVLLAFAGGALTGCDSDDILAQDPPEMEEGFVEVNGANIYYRIDGDEGDPPLVLIHGYPLSGQLFQEQRAGLSNDYRVITFDLRGYGQSTAPEGTSATIETYANDVLAAMDELGIEEAAIGGMSMGGPIVLQMFSQAPDRFAGLLLIDTIAAPANPAEAGTWTGLAEILQQENEVSALPPLIIDEMLTGEARMNEPALADSLISIMNEASFQAALSGLGALANRPDLRPVLDDVEVPTLVLVGLQDTIYPYEISQGMVDAIGENAEIAIIDNASHAAVFERGGAANDAIRGWADGIDFDGGNGDDDGDES